MGNETTAKSSLIYPYESGKINFNSVIDKVIPQLSHSFCSMYFDANNFFTFEV